MGEKKYVHVYVPRPLGIIAVSFERAQLCVCSAITEETLKLMVTTI